MGQTKILRDTIVILAAAPIARIDGKRSIGEIKAGIKQPKEVQPEQI